MHIEEKNYIALTACMKRFFAYMAKMSKLSEQKFFRFGFIFDLAWDATWFCVKTNSLVHTMIPKPIEKTLTMSLYLLSSSKASHSKIMILHSKEKSV